MRLHLMLEVITIMTCVYLVRVQSKPIKRSKVTMETIQVDDNITFRIYPTKKSFFDAEEKCRRSGGKLLTIKNLERQVEVDRVMNEWLQNKWNSVVLAKGIWIGLSLAQVKYQWSDGEIAQYLNWVTDIRPNEQCSEISRPARFSTSFRWKLDFCRKKQPFICEYDSNVSVPPGGKTADIPEDQSQKNVVEKPEKKGEKGNVLETAETTTVDESPEPTATETGTLAPITLSETSEATTVTEAPETSTVSDTPETTITEAPETSTNTETPENTSVSMQTLETTTTPVTQQTTTTEDLSHMFFGGR